MSHIEFPYDNSDDGGKDLDVNINSDDNIKDDNKIETFDFWINLADCIKILSNIMITIFEN